MLSPYELSGSRYAPTINPVPVSLFYYKMRSLQQGRNPSDDLLSSVAGIVDAIDIRPDSPLGLVGIGHHGYEISSTAPILVKMPFTITLSRRREAKNINQHDSIHDPIDGWKR